MRRTSFRGAALPPPQLRGRGGALHFQTPDLDIWLIVTYFEPFSGLATDYERWKQGAFELLAWVRGLLEKSSTIHADLDD